jgi:NADH-quinone oxidoreductase chain I
VALMKLLKDLKSLVQGLGITGKHLGRHAITLQYPEERMTLPERSRGIVVLLSDKETGELNCTACMLCMRACPTGAITIDAPRDEKKKRHLKQFIVDHGICCFCGLCEEACNFSAIKMATKYEFSAERKEDLVWDIKKLQEVGRDVPYEDTRKKKKAAAKPAAAAAKAAAKPSKPPAGEQKEKGAGVENAKAAQAPAQKTTPTAEKQASDKEEAKPKPPPARQEEMFTEPEKKDSQGKAENEDSSPDKEASN